MEILEQLKQVETYFMFWLNDNNKEKITAEELPGILESLFKNINKIPLCMDPIVITDENKKKLDKEDKEEKSLDLHNILKDLGAYLIETFFYIHTNQLLVANQALDKATAYKNYCAGLKHDETLDYFVGIQYLIDLLQFHMTIVDPDLQNNINLDLPTIPNGLSDKGRAAILVAKWKMNEVFSYRSSEALEDLKQIAKLDSEYWNWHYVLCCRQRAIRRNPCGDGIRSEPSEVEIQSSIKCLQVVPKDYRSKVTGISIQVLAEVVRYRYDSRKDGVYKYGEQPFKDNREIIDYILETIRSTINNKEKTSAGTYVRFGEILSSILPNKFFKYQEYQREILVLAEDCLTKSLEKKPKNSKANHRMGIFQQTNKKDMVKAQDHFKVAIKSKSNNFPAYMNLIPALMRSKNIKDNFTKLGSIFDEIFNRPKDGFNSFSKSQLWKFKFLQGVYFFKIGKLIEAFKLWTDCYHDQENDDQLQKEFENLDKMQKRCLTTRGEFISLKHIHQSLKTTNEEHQFDEIKEIIKKLCAN